MKRFTLVFFIVLFAFQGYSQCFIDPYIQAHYEVDAKVLALREILTDPLDPDYNNPFLPEERYTPYLERLSALYTNPHNSSMVDSLFNEFKFHVNLEYSFPTPIKGIAFSVNNNTPWLEDFKNTGISGVAALDELMVTYQFSIDSFFVLPSTGKTYFTIITAYDFLNVTALIDDFVAVSDIQNPHADISLEGRFNYTGVPYMIGGWLVELCDIWVENDIFTFGLWSDDCMAGCQKWEFRFADVTEDCEVLSTPKDEVLGVSIYPNPTSDKLYFQGLMAEIQGVEIYSLQGKLIRSYAINISEIDVSQLSSGIYFIKVLTSDGRKTAQRFIRK